MLNQRQELFCQNMILGKSATESAILAGYHENTARTVGPRLLQNVAVCQRISALQQAVTTGNIATVTKRKEILTDIANDNHKEPVTAHERVKAISELNKMEKVYTESVTIDNRTVNVIVSSEKAKELTENISKRLEDAI